MLDRNTPWRLHRVSLVPLLLAVSLPFGCQNPAQDCTPAGSCGTQTTTDGGSESGSTETRSTVGSSSDQAENSTSGEPTEPTVLDQVFDQAVAEGFSGVALVRYQGEVLLHSAAGFASREDGIANETDTPIVMGSITKQFTGAAILRLREQGGVEQDETLADFPNVPADNATLESVCAARGSLRGPSAGRPKASVATARQLRLCPSDSESCVRAKTQKRPTQR